jgi:hypothetical protein
MPHRAEFIDSIKRMKEISTEKWLIEMKEYFWFFVKVSG